MKRLHCTVLCFVGFFWLVSPGHAATKAGDVDLTFDPGPWVNGVVRSVAVQADGKIVIAGNFTKLHGQLCSGVARLNADGTTDFTFKNDLPHSPQFARAAVQPDGKVIVAGDSGLFGASLNIVRHNVDGSLDTSFLPGTNGSILSIALQADGKVLIGGDFNFNGVARHGIARLNADGTLDTSFQNGMDGLGAGLFGDRAALSMAQQPDGKVLVGGTFNSVNGVSRRGIARLSTDGSLDTTFQNGMSGADGGVYSIAVQSNDKVLIGGRFTGVNGIGRNRVARLNADGSLDTSFQNGLLVLSGDLYGSVYSVAVQSDGKVLIGGDFYGMVNGFPRNAIIRMNANGSPDNTFQNGMAGVQLDVNNHIQIGDLGAPYRVPGAVFAIALQPDGALLIGGDFSSINGVPGDNITRLQSNGSMDADFTNSNPAGVDRLGAVALQSDGKVLVAGGYTTRGYLSVPNGITRLNPDGSLDTGFQSAIVSNVLAVGVASIAVQPDSKILIGGSFTSVNGLPRNNIARLNPDGGLDSGFQAGLAGVTGSSGTGSVNAIAVQLDGKVLIGGSFNSVNGMARHGIARLNADGSLDTDFQADAGIVNSINVQPDGKVLLGGDFPDGVNNASGYGIIARLNTDGSLDGNFQDSLPATNSFFYGSVSCVALQSDGKVLIGGDFVHFNRANGAQREGIARLNSDGSLDDFNAEVWGPQFVRSVLAQPDGQVLISGNFDPKIIPFNGPIRHGLARLNPDGSMDTSFFQDGFYSGGPLALQPDGKVLVGGVSFSPYYPLVPGITRLFGRGPEVVIYLQPKRQLVPSGTNVIFRITAAGDPPLSYQWFKNGTVIPGATNSLLSLPAVRAIDNGIYSAIVSNAFSVTNSSGAILQVGSVPVADASATATLAISPFGGGATVILDGSRSYDSDGNPLVYYWSDENGFLGEGGPVFITVLPVGTHAITLQVNVGLLFSYTNITVEVITGASAVQRLVDLAGTSPTDSRSLKSTLTAAIASIDTYNSTAAINQLVAFQNKAQAQVARLDPALAQTFIQAAQQIIDGLKDGNSSGKPHGNFDR